MHALANHEILRNDDVRTKAKQGMLFRRQPEVNLGTRIGNIHDLLEMLTSLKVTRVMPSEVGTLTMELDQRDHGFHPLWMDDAFAFHLNKIIYLKRKTRIISLQLNPYAYAPTHT